MKTISPTTILSRRNALQWGTGGVLSATAVALLAGEPALAKGKKGHNAEEDVAILNIALGLEQEAIAAYQIGAESGLLSDGVLPTAVLFQSQHKEHRDVLTSTIKTLGGTPVEAQSQKDYAKALKAGTLKSQEDVLRLAAELERGAAEAYISVVPSFQDRNLAKVSARLVADETMHWTVLAQALGEPLPKMALSFGK